MDHSATALAIASLDALSALLGVAASNILRMANRAGCYYRSFDEVHLGTGKTRHYDEPLRPLKKLQQIINKKFLALIPLPDTTLGGVSGRSIKHNAQYHIKRPVVITLDLKNCFPMTSDKRVYQTYLENGCSAYVANLLTKLTTYHHRLPQGAPTSLSLCNLCLLPLHKEIADIAASFDVQFTLYVDDITLSGAQSREAMSPIIQAIQRHGYSIRHRKTHIMTASQQQVVTGVVVNRRTTAPRAKIKDVRKQIIGLSKQDVIPSYRLRSIRGQIAHIKFLSPAKGSKLEVFANRLLTSDIIEMPKPLVANRRSCKSTHHHNNKYKKK